MDDNGLCASSNLIKPVDQNWYYSFNFAPGATIPRSLPAFDKSYRDSGMNLVLTNNPLGGQLPKNHRMVLLGLWFFVSGAVKADVDDFFEQFIFQASYNGKRFFLDRVCNWPAPGGSNGPNVVSHGPGGMHSTANLMLRKTASGEIDASRLPTLTDANPFAFEFSAANDFTLSASGAGGNGLHLMVNWQVDWMQP